MNHHHLTPIIITLLCVFIAWGCASSVRAQQTTDSTLHPAVASKRFMVYYGSDHDAQHFMPYDVLVFDRDHHPDLANLHHKGKIILGYVSGGEGEQTRHDYHSHQHPHLLKDEKNPNWDDNKLVDVRSPAWTAYLIENVIPDIIHQGFDGIFIDTLDSIEHLEKTKPDRYQGMVDGAVTMIKTIRLHYPDIKIMVNRAYDIVPQVAGEIDYVLGEGVMAEYDFKTGKSSLFPKEIYQEYVERMAALKKTAPHLQIMTLDYWDMKDKEGVAYIYNTHRTNGFSPYVTTIDLEHVHEHE